MLITNGKITRNISEGKFAEYAAKGYTEVKPIEKPKPQKKESK